jgi:polar amino acid transport system substrate-binding protein
MKPHSFLRASAVAVLGLSAITSGAVAQQAILREQGTTAETSEARQTLAPAGRLRVGVYAGSPYSMIRDPVSGETKGIAIELGAALAMRLGVLYEQIEFRRPAEIYAALKAEQVDVTIANATPERADEFAWSPPLMLIELGFLVPPGSPVAEVADIDKPGVRVGVTQGGTMNGELAHELKNATVVPAPTLKTGTNMLAEHTIDAYATNKANLFEMSDALPGSRVLAGRWGVEHLAMAIPSDHGAGLAYLRAFVEDMRSQGLVARAAARAGLRGIAAE